MSRMSNETFATISCVMQAQGSVLPIANAFVEFRSAAFRVPVDVGAFFLGHHFALAAEAARRGLVSRPDVLAYLRGALAEGDLELAGWLLGAFALDPAEPLLAAMIREVIWDLPLPALGLLAERLNIARAFVTRHRLVSSFRLYVEDPSFRPEVAAWARARFGFTSEEVRPAETLEMVEGVARREAIEWFVKNFSSGALSRTTWPMPPRWRARHQRAPAGTFDPAELSASFHWNDDSEGRALAVCLKCARCRPRGVRPNRPTRSS